MGQQGNGIIKHNLKLDVLSLAPQILLKLTNLESKEIGWLKLSERRIIVNVFVLDHGLSPLSLSTLLPPTLNVENISTYRLRSAKIKCV